MDLNYKNQLRIYKENKKGEVEYLTFPVFQSIPFITHGFSTRIGGVSKGHIASMNLNFQLEESGENVKENFRRMGEALNIPIEHMVGAVQTHTTNVKKVGKKDCGKGVLFPTDFVDVDGFITNEPNVCLFTGHADCVPIFLVDPVQRAIGMIHAGWKGTVGKIGKNAVESMKREFSSRPEDILAAIGPAICKKCYEVSDDVITHIRDGFPKEVQQRFYDQTDHSHYQLDMWEMNRWILEEAGLIPTHITMTNLCTCCNSSVLFSHRGSKGKRGGMCGFIMLRERAYE